MENEPFGVFVFPDSPARDVPVASPSSLAGVWLGFAKGTVFFHPKHGKISVIILLSGNYCRSLPTRKTEASNS